MGRHAAPRTPPPVDITRLAALVAVAISLAVIAIPLGISTAHRGSTVETAPLKVVPGAVFTERIFTLRELEARFAKAGLSHVTGDPRKPTRFVAASFNVLGSSHAGNGPGRAARGGAMIRAKGVSVVGLQEFQGNQRAPFLRAAKMTSYPSVTDRLGAENSVAWDPKKWSLVEGRMQTIPYFYGKSRSMPLVLLRSRATGRMVWWMNVHNPADVFGCRCGGWRAKAISVEIAKINELHKDGTPVFFTGDLNDRSAVVCRIAVGTGMVSADGSHSAGGKGGSCRPSSSLWIDWVWGTNGDVRFTKYVRDYRTRSGPRISDHPMITATAVLEPATKGRGCRSYQRHATTYWFCPDPTLGSKSAS